MNEIDHNKDVDNIISLAKSIQVGKITILTGQNGHGKSVIRKILGSHISKCCGVDPNHCVSSVSMEGRTSSSGPLSAFIRDNPENPTSLETYHNIKRLFKVTFLADNKRYLIIDEPEIGCSEETQLGIANYINKFTEIFHDETKCYGVLIITHSKVMASSINHDCFINIGGMTEDEWINRKIEPVDLDELERYSDELNRTIERRMKKST